MNDSGILIINKPEGLSSHMIVNRVRRIFGTKTVGHSGTLDPMATGVLPVLVGRAVKAAEYMQDHDKSYLAGIKLGTLTDSGDITGNILSVYDGELPSFEQFKATALSFVGTYMQTPPMYSALKVGGIKLLELARKGIEVERTARKVTIYGMDVFEKDGGIYMAVDCSKGTYIRTLCEDIGEKLGCGATLCSLSRTKVGEYGIENAFTLEELAEMNEDALRATLIPVDTVFADLPEIRLPAFYEKLFKNGCEIYMKKLRPPACIDREAEGVMYRVSGAEGFIALAESVRFSKGVALKCRKMFFNE